MKLIFSLFLSFLYLGIIQAQQDNCSYPEAKDFDFWIGDWKVVWKNPDGTISEGTNSISKILGGCVIEENFNGQPALNLVGKSLSVYNPVKKKWEQTWVDNSGGYMDFEGEYKDQKMILQMERYDKDNNKVLMRMVFHNIEENSFVWDWQKSTDNGNNWENQWTLNYTRIK